MVALHVIRLCHRTLWKPDSKNCESIEEPDSRNVEAYEEDNEEEDWRRRRGARESDIGEGGTEIKIIEGFIYIDIYIYSYVEHKEWGGTEGVV